MSDSRQPLQQPPDTNGGGVYNSHNSHHEPAICHIIGHVVFMRAVHNSQPPMATSVNVCTSASGYEAGPDLEQ